MFGFHVLAADLTISKVEFAVKTNVYSMEAEMRVKEETEGGEHA